MFLARPNSRVVHQTGSGSGYRWHFILLQPLLTALALNLQVNQTVTRHTDSDSFPERLHVCSLIFWVQYQVVFSVLSSISSYIFCVMIVYVAPRAASLHIVASSGLDLIRIYVIPGDFDIGLARPASQTSSKLYGSGDGIQKPTTCPNTKVK